MRLLAVISALGGVASRRELIKRGLSGTQLTAGVRDGVVFRVRQGHYALPDAPRDAVVAVRIGGRVGCLSALRSYGLWGGLDDEATHVTLPRNASRLRAFRDDERVAHSDRHHDRDCVLHWDDTHVSGRGPDASSWRVGLEHALVQVTRCAARPTIRAAFESAVVAGSLRLDEAQSLLDAVIAYDERRLVLSERSGSGAESHLIELLDGLGLRFVQQVVFAGVGRVDFVVEGILVVEVDGYTYHREPAQFDEDRRRDAAMLGRGLPTLRLPARFVVTQPALAASRIVDTITAVRAMRAGSRPAAVA